MTQQNLTTLDKGQGKPSSVAISTKVASGVALVDSRLISRALGRKHHGTLELIKGRREEFSEGIGEGIVRFKTEQLQEGSGRPVCYALLTEGQAMFLLTLMRNSPRVVQAKAEIVLAFKKSKEANEAHKTQYLPLHHRCHDAINSAHTGGDMRLVHMNIEKMINAAIGIKSGERDKLPAEKKGLISQAYALTLNAFISSPDAKTAYMKAKATVTQLAALMLPAVAAIGVRND